MYYAISFSSMNFKDECYYDIMDASVSLPEYLDRYIGTYMMKESGSVPSIHLSKMNFQLSIDNQIIPMKCAILCHFKDTVFANQFNDSKWMLENMF